MHLSWWRSSKTKPNWVEAGWPFVFSAIVGNALVAAWLLMLAVSGLGGCGYNTLQCRDESIKAAWGEVLNQYQRRADLIPNLVNTVAGAANFEKSTLTEVTNARASVGQVKLDPSKGVFDERPPYPDLDNVRRGCSDAGGGRHLGWPGERFRTR
jgi:LemA protein